MSLLTDLLAYYKTDEASGDAADASGNGKTMTNVGSMAYGTGIINNGANTIGLNGDYLERTDILGRTAGNNGNLTISHWVKFTSMTGGGNLVDTFDNANSPYIQFNTHAIPTKFRFNRGRIGVANVYTDKTMTVSNGVWYHVVLTWDGTTITGYVNDDGSPVTGTPSGNGAVGATARARIGDGDGNDPSLINDEIGYWNRAISSTEVTELYNGGAALPFADFGGASGPANLKTWDGLAKASIKSINGLAMASIKSVNGLA